MEYNLAYLQNLIDGKVEENSRLEYKRPEALEGENFRTNLSKEISAFANTAGGVLIYGMKEEDHLPTEIMPLDRNKMQRETLEQLIRSNINPPIDNLEILPIEIEETNKVVYILIIPMGETAHQAKDKKYHRRNNFTLESMEDYQIRDVMNRQKHPKVVLNFFIKQIKYESASPYFNPLKGNEKSSEIIEYYELYVAAKNIGNILTKYLNADVTIPRIFFNQDELSVSDKHAENIEFYLDNKVRDIVGSELIGMQVKNSYGPYRFEPLLPKTSRTLDSDFPKLTKFFHDHNEKVISWRIYCDNAEPRVGSIRIDDIEIIRNG